MIGFARLPAAILLAGAIVGCSGGGAANPTGTGGTGGGGNPNFMAFAPCSLESAYKTTGTTITFGGADGDNYNPPCLAVAAGTAVTFSGDFSMHPLTPSAIRGRTTGSPIAPTSGGDTLSVLFLDGGFYAYFCSVHGSDDGQTMSGVVWAK